uniref:Solute carrier family 25 member 36 n=1 Tax=Oryctolagus cuniculus TaxID=9986 RepID=A0A5F9DNS4_RABIT
QKNVTLNHHVLEPDPRRLPSSPRLEPGGQPDRRVRKSRARPRPPTTLGARPPPGHALRPRPAAPFIQKALSDHVKEACGPRGVTRLGPIGSSVYVGEGGRAADSSRPLRSRPRLRLPLSGSGCREIAEPGRAAARRERRGEGCAGGSSHRPRGALRLPSGTEAVGRSGRPDPRPASAPRGHAGERMSQRDTLVHLFAGGCGGTVGAILTCPLEVVKTRLQSSSVTLYISEVQLNTMAGASVNRIVSPGPLHCLKVILEKEGPRSLFRGLGPNLVGVAPSRAIYFAAYSNCKEKLNGVFDPDSTQVHMISAAMAEYKKLNTK